jgi:hypothetical protein
MSLRPTALKERTGTGGQFMCASIGVAVNGKGPVDTFCRGFYSNEREGS